LKHRSQTAALTALLALMSASAQAQTAKPCLTEREVAQMAIYAAPSLIEGVRGKCSARLSKTGFLATRGDAFAAKYAALQNETWPVAKTGILKFVGNTASATRRDDPVAMFASLPDEAVRPLVDAMIVQKIGEAVKPDACSSVERGIQLASVVSPRDSGAILAFVMAVTKPKNAPICPARS
jgi:hypothetical protein